MGGSLFGTHGIECSSAPGSSGVRARGRRDGRTRKKCPDADGQFHTDPAAPLTSQKAIMDNSAKIRRPALPSTGSQADPSYRLGPEDQLRISVWDNKELTLDLVVRPDGKISMPLLQDVPAEGLTAAQLAANIQEGLSAYIVNPEVTVIVLAGQRAEILYYRICDASGHVPLARRYLGSPGARTGRRIDPVRLPEKHQADPGDAWKTGGPKNQLLQPHRRWRRGELPPQIRRHDRGAVNDFPRRSALCSEGNRFSGLRNRTDPHDGHRCDGRQHGRDSLGPARGGMELQRHSTRAPTRCRPSAPV